MSWLETVTFSSVLWTANLPRTA